MRHNDMTHCIRRAYHLMSAYLLLIPTTFHPWYVIWILPCLCFYPSWGWLYFSGAIALSYVAYAQDYPVLPTGIYLLEFLPLYLLLVVQGVWQRGRSPVPEPTAAALLEHPK
jgi:hypothetical protein